MSVQEETEKAVALAKRALKRCNELEERIENLAVENRELRDENDRLKQRIADIEERDTIADTVINGKRLKVEERAAVCIETLANTAYRRKRRGESASATMDYNGADKALGGELDRRQLLDALERAGELVESNAVEFKAEPRHTRKNSRLIVDLEAGELPSTVAGRSVQPEVA